MGTSAAIAILLAAAQISATIPAKDKEQQEQVFQTHWQTDFEWQFENLPEKGSVPGHQMPYSGYIYPDKSGGTKSIMAMYDRAFHYGRTPATSFEDWDTKAYKSKVDIRGPIFGLTWGKKNDVPAWSGHCNGWAAAAIRHAEPQQSVRRNGVVFEPSDIKGLLAELYIYNDIADLSGSGDDMNAGLFHAVITNWLGRANHAVAMEADPGEEKWNYPIYAFTSDSAQRSPRYVEVKVNLGYLKDSNGEYEESPKINRVKYFHYALELDAMGKIVGGRFYQDSAVIDMIWLPLQPKPGRRPGNEAGNPHLNVNEVLAIWRDSVPEDVRNKWIVIDPPVADSRLVLEKDREMLPVGYNVIRPNPPVHVEMDVVETEEPTSEPRRRVTCRRRDNDFCDRFTGTDGR